MPQPYRSPQSMDCSSYLDTNGVTIWVLAGDYGLAGDYEPTRTLSVD